MPVFELIKNLLCKKQVSLSLQSSISGSIGMDKISTVFKSEHLKKIISVYERANAWFLFLCKFAKSSGLELTLTADY